jgi:protein-disulfide isomerase
VSRSSFALSSIVASIFLLNAACTKITTQSAGSNPEDDVTYALVNGKEIKGRDVLNKVKSELAELKQNEYEIKRRSTGEVVQQMILEEEAKKQGTTVDKLFSQFDSLRDREVSKDDIKNFLKSRNLEDNKITKQERDSIPQVIKMQRVYDARQKYVAELREKANVQMKVPRPAETRYEVGVGRTPPIGNAKAKVTIVEFSDFQCPFCAEGRKRVEDIVEKYHDKVKIYFRNFPLETRHPQAFLAAEAGECALDQNRFWDFHNYLFDHQEKLDQKSLILYAETIHMDAKVFEECLKSGTKEAAVRSDMNDASKLTVTSTPTFFVNGRVLRGAMPLESFIEIIDEELAR